MMITSENPSPYISALSSPGREGRVCDLAMEITSDARRSETKKDFIR